METKRRARLKWKSYFNPTPKRVRVLGDSLAVASIFVAGLNLEDSRVMMACAICGGLGKFMSNFIDIDNGVDKS